MYYIGSYKGIRCYRIDKNEYKEKMSENTDKIYVDCNDDMIWTGKVFAHLKGNGEVEEFEHFKPYVVSKPEVEESKPKSEIDVLLDIAFEPWDVWVETMKVEVGIDDLGVECK